MNKLLALIVIVLIVFLSVIFLMWQLDVVIPLAVKMFFLIVVVCIVLFVTMFHLLSQQKVTGNSDRMEKAEDFARVWWHDKTKEDLTYESALGKEGYYDDKNKFFGFILNRKSGLQPVVLIVKVNKNGQMGIHYWNDKPEFEEKTNPFAKLSWLEPTPVEKPNIEAQPSYVKRRSGLPFEKRTLTRKKKPNVFDPENIEIQPIVEEELEERLE